MYIVAGTQADQSQNNEIQIMKLSQLHKTRQSQRNEEESDSDDDDDNIEEDPLLEHRSLPTNGGTNRIRVHQSNISAIAASWSELGKVHLWNILPSYNSLSQPGYTADAKADKPMYTVKNHRDEGYGLAFSADGALLSGDNQGKIYLTQPTSSHYTTSPHPFKSHAPKSVEDIQWSPSEKTVFASVSSSGEMHIHDLRAESRDKPIINVKASQGDVNVLSWNSSVAYLVITGDDNGITKVWDLRHIKKDRTGSNATVAEFSWHKSAITSVEWCPSDSSVFASSGADEQVCIFDLSTEADDEELPNTSTDMKDVPQQLLFIHQVCLSFTVLIQGQRDVKELRWHKQIPGCLITTAADGLNVFKTISV
jgi:ribosome assembly protein RRB1